MNTDTHVHTRAHTLICILI